MNDETNEMGDVPYQRGIGSLMYTATITRLDIAFPIAILSQFMWNPGVMKVTYPPFYFLTFITK
jgi:hypothetical protein